MMRVFIADDEEIIRDGIRNCIEKEQERFLFAGEAPDGEMALPMLMEMKPDVLITDIRMPFMDGLELAKVVRRTMPWLRIVFLSGHDEFEYAQTAVSLPICSSRSVRRSCSKRWGRWLSRSSRSNSSFVRRAKTAAANRRRTSCGSIFLTTCSRAACRLQRRLYRENAGGCC